MTFKLLVKSLSHEKVRLLTAILGVAAATGLFVWSLGLAMTAGAQSRIKVRRMSAPFDCWVSSSGVGMPLRRGAPPPPGFVWSGRAASLPGVVVEQVRQTPQLERVEAYSVMGVTLDYRPDGRVMQGPPMSANLTLAQASGSPYANARVTGEWPDPRSPELEVAVCTSIFTPRRLTPPPLGSTLVMITPAGTVNAKICAYIERPEIIRGFPTAFGTLGVVRQAAGGHFDDSPTLLLCQSRSGGDTTAALKTIAENYASMSTTARDTSELVVSALGRTELEMQFSSDSLQNFKRQAPLLLTLAVFTALCMMVNALIVGVDQKQRVLSLLRAVGMTPAQMLRLVALEGLLVALCGWLFGVLGGWGVLTLFVRRTPETFPEGVSLGWQTPLFAALGVALIALVSLWWPCRRALRIRPLEALAEHTDTDDPSGRTGRGAVVLPWLGFAMLFPMLLLALPLPVSAMTRSILILLVGIPLHIVGLLLCLPSFVGVVERLCGPPLALLLGLDGVMLRRRLSRHAKRVVGTALTLAVGLGSFIAIHIWGASLTKPFIPSKEFPDVIVSMLPNGVKGEAPARVAQLAGVADGRCLAIEAAQFDISDELAAQATRVSGRPPANPNLLVWGSDPQLSFGGERPLADMRFTAGDRLSAAEALRHDDNCIVTLMFARETGLRLGDTLAIKTRPHGNKDGAGSARATPLKHFKVAGIVDLNWHLVTSRANMRGRHGQSGGTMGPLFVNEGVARQLSGNLDTTFFLWLNLSETYRAMDELAAGQTLEADIRKTLDIDQANTIRVHHRDEIADGTIAHGAQLIGDMARAPFWSLVVLSTGLVALLIASYQASAREFAMMRAVGMTRGQLARLLLGEALLAGWCGILMSLASGFCIGWTFTGWTRAWMSFGGLPLSLEIPWSLLLQGIGFAVLLCLLMSAGPVLWLSRRDSPIKEARS